MEKGLVDQDVNGSDQILTKTREDQVGHIVKKLGHMRIRT